MPAWIRAHRDVDRVAGEAVEAVGDQYDRRFGSLHVGAGAAKLADRDGHEGNADNNKNSTEGILNVVRNDRDRPNRVEHETERQETEKNQLAAGR